MTKLEIDPKDLFKTLKPELQARCRKIFEEARNARGNSPEKNGSARPATKYQVQKMETIPPSSPLCAVARAEETRAAVANLAFTMNYKMSKDTIEAVAEVLTRAKWTIGELDRAAVLIPSDHELCKTMNYNRGVTPAVFAEARNRIEVKRGRLHTRQEALAHVAGEKSTLDAMYTPVIVGDKTMMRMN